MDETPRRRRKWLWIALGIVLGVPAIFIFVLTCLLHVNAIRPDQKQMPVGMIKSISSATHAANTTLSNGAANKTATGATSASLAQLRGGAPKTYQDIVDSDPNSKRAAAYKAFQAKHPNFYEKEWRDSCMADWRPGKPLTEEQKKWLGEHQDLINDIVNLAAAGGFPHLTHAQVLAMDPKDAIKIPPPNFQEAIGMARILAGETSRRADAGDPKGAVETLSAILPLAQSMREPLLLGHLISVAMQSTANRQLADWMSNSAVPSDFARQIHDQLAGQIILGQQLRLTFELEYQVIRPNFVDLLGGSFTDLLRNNISNRLGASPDELDILQNIYNRPLQTTQGVISGTWQSIAIGANRSGALDGYDAAYQRIFEIIDQNSPVEPSTENSYILPVPNASEALVRTDANLALLRINLIGLDLISGGAGQEPDPFSDYPILVKQDGDATVIYSVGPDRQDDGGAVFYDPSNGTMSRGDILIRVPRRR